MTDCRPSYVVPRWNDRARAEPPSRGKRREAAGRRAEGRLSRRSRSPGIATKGGRGRRRGRGRGRDRTLWRRRPWRSSGRRRPAGQGHGPPWAAARDEGVFRPKGRRAVAPAGMPPRNGTHRVSGNRTRQGPRQQDEEVASATASATATATTTTTTTSATLHFTQRASASSRQKPSATPACLLIPGFRAGSRLPLVG